jgi:hypothetical protein
MKSKCSCISCKREISVSNIKNHYKSKSCLSNNQHKPKSENCEFCLLSFNGFSTSEKGNHVRWCKSNPKYSEYIKKAKDLHKYATDESRAKANEKIKIAHVRGSYVNSYKKGTETKLKNGTINHTEDTKIKLREIALASNHQRVCKSTHIFIDKRGREFKFDSSWEDALAIRLDFLNINWDRPQPITYILNGSPKKYFADFYLPDYNVYLDPKNKYVQKVQSEKINIVKELINLIIIPSKKECETFTI